MSGVVMAFIIPSKARFDRPYVLHKIKFFSQKLLSYDRIDDETMFPNGPQRHILRRIHKTAYGSLDMSYRVEHALSPWVNFVIMPIFALANAGVEIPDLSYFNIFNTAGITGGVGLGIFLGLVLGKPLGITLFSFAAIKSRLCEMPDKAGWAMFFAVACLGGIGFTMSIFVDTLSFQDAAAVDEMRNAGKIAILMGSLSAGILGSVLIKLVSKLPDSK
jgi:NhaA family Na+:H+ antiporter